MNIDFIALACHGVRLPVRIFQVTVEPGVTAMPMGVKSKFLIRTTTSAVYATDAVSIMKKSMMIGRAEFIAAPRGPRLYR
jgi:hypothetical protein